MQQGKVSYNDYQSTPMPGGGAYPGGQGTMPSLEDILNRLNSIRKGGIGLAKGLKNYYFDTPQGLTDLIGLNLGTVASLGLKTQPLLNTAVGAGIGYATNQAKELEGYPQGTNLEIDTETSVYPGSGYPVITDNPSKIKGNFNVGTAIDVAGGIANAWFPGSGTALNQNFGLLGFGKKAGQEYSENTLKDGLKQAAKGMKAPKGGGLDDVLYKVGNYSPSVVDDGVSNLTDQVFGKGLSQSETDDLFKQFNINTGDDVARYARTQYIKDLNQAPEFASISEKYGIPAIGDVFDNPTIRTSSVIDSQFQPGGRLANIPEPPQIAQDWVSMAQDRYAGTKQGFGKAYDQIMNKTKKVSGSDLLPQIDEIKNNLVSIDDSGKYQGLIKQLDFTKENIAKNGITYDVAKKRANDYWKTAEALANKGDYGAAYETNLGLWKVYRDAKYAVAKESDPTGKLVKHLQKADELYTKKANLFNKSKEGQLVQKLGADFSDNVKKSTKKKDLSVDDLLEAFSDDTSIKKLSEVTGYSEDEIKNQVEASLFRKHQADKSGAYRQNVGGSASTQQYFTKSDPNTTVYNLKAIEKDLTDYSTKYKAAFGDDRYQHLSTTIKDLRTIQLEDPALFKELTAGSVDGNLKLNPKMFDDLALNRPDFAKKSPQLRLAINRMRAGLTRAENKGWIEVLTEQAKGINR